MQKLMNGFYLLHPRLCSECLEKKNTLEHLRASETRRTLEQDLKPQPAGFRIWVTGQLGGWPLHDWTHSSWGRNKDWMYSGVMKRQRNQVQCGSRGYSTAPPLLQEAERSGWELRARESPSSSRLVSSTAPRKTCAVTGNGIVPLQLQAGTPSPSTQPWLCLGEPGHQAWKAPPNWRIEGDTEEKREQSKTHKPTDLWGQLAASRAMRKSDKKKFKETKQLRD